MLLYTVSIYSLRDYAKNILQVKFNDLDKAVRYVEQTWQSVDNDSIEVAIILPAHI